MNPLDHKLFASVPFLLRMPNGTNKPYVQVGNAVKCELMLMPVDTEEEREYVVSFIERWNASH